MAFTPRLWQTIQNQIKAAIAAEPGLSGLTSQSQAAQWQLWTFNEAVASNLNEQAMAVLLDEMETIISQGAPSTSPWIQQKVLLFQYNTSTPYLVSYNNGIIGYDTTVIADQIISNCAVVVSSSGVVTIKVTTGSPAGPLNSSQLIALGSYLTNFLNPNQRVNVISINPDKLWITGTVFYNGQLNSSIQDSVNTALSDYITAFSTSQSLGGSFNGVVKVSDIEKVILGVAGVTDWVPTQITLTTDSGAATNLILASTQVRRSFSAYSGYVINDPAHDFSTTLTFTPANN